MQAISCQQFLSGLTKCCDPSDLCATNATTASACPVESYQASTASDDPNAAPGQCPELPPGVTCSAFVGECSGAQACNARVSKAEFVDNGNSDNTVGVCVNYTAAGSPCTAGYGLHTPPSSAASI
ncbi:hypothetical protein WJX82_011502 [Trebouxia sp. C0006]